MLRQMLKSKIHGARVTDLRLHYEGSISIDQKLLEATDILPGEKVQVVNLANGARVETYAIVAKKGSGTICMNGAAARAAHVGDEIIIMCFALAEEGEAQRIRPKVLRVDENNRMPS